MGFLGVLGVLTIFICKGWGRNPEIGNAPIWDLSNIWRVRDIKFGTNVSNEMLLNTAECKVYDPYCFWVWKGTPTEGGTPRLSLKENSKSPNY